MNGRVYDPLLARFGIPDPMTVAFGIASSIVAYFTRPGVTNPSGPYMPRMA
jgi:hypothetical protein